MMQTFLIQALFGLGGVFLILGITIFHYFKTKVDECISERINAYFTSSSSMNLNKALQKGTLPLPVIKDFYRDLIKILEPNRRLRSLLLIFPLNGFVFVLSAFFASMPSIFGESISSYFSTLEVLSNLALLFAIVMLFYGVFQLIRLTQNLT